MPAGSPSWQATPQQHAQAVSEPQQQHAGVCEVSASVFRPRNQDRRISENSPGRPLARNKPPPRSRARARVEQDGSHRGFHTRDSRAAIEIRVKCGVFMCTVYHSTLEASA